MKEGVEALLLKDEHGIARAYSIVQPAGHYYRTMMKSDWMLVLVREGAESTPISLDCIAAARPASLSPSPPRL